MKMKFSLLMVMVIFFSVIPFSISNAYELIYSTSPTKTAWLVYWDTDSALEELIEQSEEIDSLVFFAAFFNMDDSLFLPYELSELKENINIMISKPEIVNYISIVNDYTLPDGKYSTKHVPLLERLLLSGVERTNKFLNEIIELALENDFQGIEIDFEALGNNIPLWENYLNFIRALHIKCIGNNLALRVVLEPRTPFASIEFPLGPQYVMMCYNLYGTHSEPGPKANYEFIKRMIDLMSVIPKESRHFALATGGYDWYDGRVIQLSYRNAETLRVEHNAAVRRTEEVINFVYHDKDGILHEIWYADPQTINYWTQVLNDAGEFNIDIWRFGGNLL